MKKFLLGIAGVIALAAPASAADLAARPYAKAPAMIAAVYDWSGFYIGANGGWGSSRKCWDNTTASASSSPAEGCHDSTGGTAGGQIGYRWQAGTWVFGVEAQGNWADFSGSNVSIAAPLADQPTRRSMPSACSPARSVTPPTTCCSTSRAALQSPTTAIEALLTGTGIVVAIAPRIRAGAAPSASAWNTASRRTGRPRSNTTICSWARPTPSRAVSRRRIDTRNERIKQDVEPSPSA